MFKIGIIGYSSGEFDIEEANNVLFFSIHWMMHKHGVTNKDEVEIVSGLTNLGIPKLSYEIARVMEYKTVGIAPKESKEYELYPVDKKIIKGRKFGDESKYFIDYIDVLIRVGGGKQSQQEAQMFKNRKKDSLILEYDLSRNA